MTNGLLPSQLSKLLLITVVVLSTGCEPVPANTVISCKLDSECPNMLRCYGNVCRRKAPLPGTSGTGAAAGTHAAAGGGAKPAPGGATGSTQSAQSMSGAASKVAAPGAGNSAPAPDSQGTAMGAAVGGAAAPAIIVMCTPDACMPGGKCVQGARDWTCTCDADFQPSEGLKRCLPIDNCPPRACVPGGKCVDGINAFTCMCDTGFTGTGTTDCKPGDGGMTAAASGTCPADACAPGGQCLPTADDFSCKCSVELRMPDPKSCPLIDKQDGTVFDLKRNLTWQKAISSTPKGVLSPLDDATTATRYCSAVTQPAATWRAPTADELRSLPALATDRHACFGTTSGVVCNDLPVESGQTTPANMLDMRCVH